MADLLEDDDDYYFGKGAVVDGRSLEARRAHEAAEREMRVLERAHKTVPLPAFSRHIFS